MKFRLFFNETDEYDCLYKTKEKEEKAPEVPITWTDPDEFLHQFAYSLENNKGVKNERSSKPDVGRVLAWIQLGMEHQDEFDINSRVRKMYGSRFVVANRDFYDTLFIKAVWTENYSIVMEFMKFPGLDVNMTTGRYSALGCAISKRDPKLVDIMLKSSKEFDLSIGSTSEVCALCYQILKYIFCVIVLGPDAVY